MESRFDGLSSPRRSRLLRFARSAESSSVPRRRAKGLVVITKKVVDGGSHVKVTFTLPAEAAVGVAVVGDFNAWDATVTPTRKRGDTRSASITLEPGSRCRFRYLDGSGRSFNDDRPTSSSTTNSAAATVSST